MIPSFKATSIISTKPIPWIVNGVDQTEAHENIDFEIAVGLTLFITTAKLVEVINPNNINDRLNISAVQIIGANNRWYYQAGSFQRAFGGDSDSALQNLVLVVE